jgi:hypothetical protein
LIYMIINDTNFTLYVAHHDVVYEEAPKVFMDIELEFPELWAVMSSDLKRYLKQ